MPEGETIRELLDRWREGDQAAASLIYQRYESRVRELACRQIGNQLRPHVQPDDIVLTVLKAVLRGAEAGRYSVDPGSSLWGLVALITRNKVRTYARRSVPRGDPEPAGSPAPTPSEVAIVADTLEAIRGRLKPSYFEIVQLLLEGYNLAEIAKKLGYVRQTIRYRLERIREDLHDLIEFAAH